MRKGMAPSRLWYLAMVTLVGAAQQTLDFQVTRTQDVNIVCDLRGVQQSTGTEYKYIHLVQITNSEFNLVYLDIVNHVLNPQNMDRCVGQFSIAEDQITDNILNVTIFNIQAKSKLSYKCEVKYDDSKVWNSSTVLVVPTPVGEFNRKINKSGITVTVQQGLSLECKSGPQSGSLLIEHADHSNGSTGSGPLCSLHQGIQSPEVCINCNCSNTSFPIAGSPVVLRFHKFRISCSDEGTYRCSNGETKPQDQQGGSAIMNVSAHVSVPGCHTFLPPVRMTTTTLPPPPITSPVEKDVSSKDCVGLRVGFWIVVSILIILVLFVVVFVVFLWRRNFNFSLTSSRLPFQIKIISTVEATASTPATGRLLDNNLHVESEGADGGEPSTRDANDEQCEENNPPEVPAPGVATGPLLDNNLRVETEGADGGEPSTTDANDEQCEENNPPEVPAPGVATGPLLDNNLRVCIRRS